MYRIKPEDAQYIEEFRKNPIGHHSPGLQRILNLFRGDHGGKYAGVHEAAQEWMLGRWRRRGGDQDDQSGLYLD